VLAAEVVPDLDEPEVLLEPEFDEAPQPPVRPPLPSPISLDEPDGTSVEVEVATVDDTITPIEPPRPEPSMEPELPPPPRRQPDESAINRIRETLESTGDIKPQPRADAAETFMVPPSKLEEAEPAILSPPDDLAGLDDEDSLDLGGDDDSMTLPPDLDDLDDE
jgi:hypothetical protein